ncbi:hypothetical protein T069G_03345 [Trichoderma breve]|uniref:Rhodopsin family protein n=1 Tax=Trichoderma breve TaxID=2034170 RepID=A0A9W9BM99_9HYPO|nr:hypothetical protein T069G_03345 [Trichoderma breve]KAJ4862391.1 hypothetical protein T069G_03345 [Trichoderma breve]
MVFFFFVCGQYTFRSEVKGYEGVICQCHNCGNMSGRVIKSRPFFTFCFVPIIPFTISGFVEVVCHICNFKQPLKNRPDAVSMQNGGNPGAGPYPPPPRQGPGRDFTESSLQALNHDPSIQPMATQIYSSSVQFRRRNFIDTTGSSFSQPVVARMTVRPVIRYKKCVWNLAETATPI